MKSKLVKLAVVLAGVVTVGLLGAQKINGQGVAGEAETCVVEDQVYQGEEDFGVIPTEALDLEDDDRIALGGDGPYRRRVSKEGYSWASAYVYLPSKAKGETKCAVAKTNGQFGEIPYVYMGGKSKYTNSKGNTLYAEVDAGLQYSYEKDDWCWCMLRSYNGIAENEKMKTHAPRFKAGQEVFMKFYVSSANHVTLSITGVTTNNKKETVTQTYYCPGWNTAGKNCRIKRLTTIAQYTKTSTGSKAAENFSSGAYVKNVKWRNVRIGTSSTNNHAWSASDNSKDTAVALKAEYNYPNSTKVSVTNKTGADNETVSIVLK